MWPVELTDTTHAPPAAIHTNLQRHTEGRGSGTVDPAVVKTPGQGAATYAARLWTYSETLLEKA